MAQRAPQLSETAEPLTLRVTTVVRGGLGGRFRSVEVVGRADLIEEPERCVAVVGARDASLEALRWARSVGAALGGAGFIVVSGGALGVDGAAHEGALDVGAPTVAVLGTGVDVAYPVRHAPLFARIVSGGGALVSPFPRGSLPRPGCFPSRNPVIAALSCATVVVEASMRSGSLGTAAAADKLGRPVYARPGAAGCASLLSHGARVALDAASLIAQLRGEATTVSAAPLVGGLLAALVTPRSAEELCRALDLALADLLESLLELESLSAIVRLPDGRWLAIRPSMDTKE